MAETRSCPQCGSAESFDARFCSTCGTALPSAATGATTWLGGQPSPDTTAWSAQAEPSMPCPVCRTIALVITDRQGIEVDYCPRCRGVWLDRGELDKIIERVAQTSPAPYAAQGGYRDAPANPTYQHDEYRRRKQRRGLLDELFDFD